METDIRVADDPNHTKTFANDSVGYANRGTKMTAPLNNESFVAKFTSCRWRLGYMSLLSYILVFAYRHSFSFAIVCMEKHVVIFSNVTTTDNITGIDIITNISVTKIVNPYIPAELKGLILSCYFYGYLLTPIIGGYLAAKFGPKLLIGLAMAVSVVVMVIMPISFRTNIYIVVALRSVLGFVSGIVVPATQVLWSNWSPISERTQLAATSNSGINIGSLVSTVVSGFLCQIPLDEGWPLTFYVYGGFGAVSLLFWMMLVYDTPELHPGCSEDEKLRIYHGKTSIKSSVKALPWKKTLRNPPFWALVTNHIAYSWITNTIQTFLPMYMSDVLRFEISENGVLSSLPSVGRFFGGLVFSFLADRMIMTTSLSVGANRKIFQSLGSIVPGAILIGLSFLNSDQSILAVGLMTLTMTMQAFTMASFRVNHLDIAPRYAGQVMGFTLTCGCCSAIVSPLVTSAITMDRTREQWQQVFILTAGIVIAADIVFVIFASGLEQDWAKANDDTTGGTCDIEVPSSSGKTQNGLEASDEHAQISDKRNEVLAREADDTFLDSIVSNAQEGTQSRDGFVTSNTGSDDCQFNGCSDHPGKIGMKGIINKAFGSLDIENDNSTNTDLSRKFEKPEEKACHVSDVVTTDVYQGNSEGHNFHVADDLNMSDVIAADVSERNMNSTDLHSRFTDELTNMDPSCYGTHCVGNCDCMDRRNRLCTDPGRAEPYNICKTSDGSFRYVTRL